MKLVIALAFIRIAKIDISTGNDLDYLRANDSSQCEYACGEVKECKAYVYNLQNKGCWLKDNLNGIREISIDAISGIKVENK